MKQFIGVKLVFAKPMFEEEAIKRGFAREKHGDHVYREGYYVLYGDGYESWSPKEAFEESYKETSGMKFGLAIEALKKGKRVTREGWNGKGMFLWLKPAVTVKADWCHDPKLKVLVESNGGEMEALGTICMKTADNKILTGWLASQTDMLAEDWVVLD